MEKHLLCHQAISIKRRKLKPLKNIIIFTFHNLDRFFEPTARHGVA